MDDLQSHVESACQQNYLLCNKCNVKVSLLDAACGPKSPIDDHPLCKHCETKLTTCNSDLARQRAEDKLARAHKQLFYLNDFIDRISNMQVPSFTTEKYQPPLQQPSNSPSAEQSLDHRDPIDTGSSVAKDLVDNANIGSTPAASGSGDSLTAAAQASVDSRAIPWFANSGGSAAANGNGPLGRGAPAMQSNTSLNEEDSSNVSFGRRSRVSAASSGMMPSLIKPLSMSVAQTPIPLTGPARSNTGSGSSLGAARTLGGGSLPYSNSIGWPGASASGLPSAGPQNDGQGESVVSRASAQSAGGKPISLSLKQASSTAKSEYVSKTEHEPRGRALSNTVRVISLMFVSCSVSDNSSRAPRPIMLKRPVPESALSKAFEKRIRF